MCPFNNKVLVFAQGANEFMALGQGPLGLKGLGLEALTEAFHGPVAVGAQKRSLAGGLLCRRTAVAACQGEDSPYAPDGQRIILAKDLVDYVVEMVSYLASATAVVALLAFLAWMLPKRQTGIGPADLGLSL
jgi:hypothetical protein